MQTFGHADSDSIAASTGLKGPCLAKDSIREAQINDSQAEKPWDLPGKAMTMEHAHSCLTCAFNLLMHSSMSLSPKPDWCLLCTLAPALVGFCNTPGFEGRCQEETQNSSQELGSYMNPHMVGEVRPVPAAPQRDVQMFHS